MKSQVGLSFSEIEERLFSFQGGKLQTFKEMQQLDKRLGHPHKTFRSVHVAGTNGKGSVALKIAKGLEAAGFRVGLYTSPHLVSFRERIQINGQMISERSVEKIWGLISPFLTQELSFFDCLTALAFMYFQQEQIDWAVIEVGMGGRLDATNVIQPLLTVITSIALEHTNILGDTLEKIAFEKGGIIKQGIPLIAGRTAAPFYPEAKYQAVLTGFYDLQNQEVARLALEELKLPEAAIQQGLAHRPPCRFEQVGSTILDVAHNPQGFKTLKEALRLFYPQEKFHFILAFSKDKDWQACVREIEEIGARISFVSSSHPRLLNLGKKSLPELLGSTSHRDVICGSFYIMEEAKQLLLSPKKETEIGDG